MKKATGLLLLALLAFFPGRLHALTDSAATEMTPTETPLPESEMQDRKEMAQVWVDRHNQNLPADVQAYVKQIKVKKHTFFISSWRKPVIRSKRIRGIMAKGLGIPTSSKSQDGAQVPLISLRQYKAGGETFITANYADDLDKLHSSADIYIKIGLQYKHLFHGEGYNASARLISLSKGSPVFFEIGTFGGGTRSDKTIYRLDTDALKAKNDELYNHPELIDVQTYVKEELKIQNWLEGFTLYKDFGKDGHVLIANSTDVVYPEELKTKVKERYKMVDNDFVGAFRQIVTLYRWDDTKAKFENMGDYYY